MLDPPSNEPLAPGTRLVVIRHGEAACNAEDFIGGHASCRGLTDRGRRQVAALAERLERTGELDGADAVWTSVLPRAIETAAILAPALGRAASRSCDLCERHPGEADGLSWAEYEERYGAGTLPGVGPDVPLSPGGESWSGFVARAAGTLAGLARSHQGRLVVVVAHGGVVDASLIAFLGLATHGPGVRFHAENSSLTEWQHTGACWRLVRYNDAAHLAGVEGALAPTPGWVAGTAQQA